MPQTYIVGVVVNSKQFAADQRKNLRQSLEGNLAYFPPKVPRHFRPDEDLIRILSSADRALGELSGVGKRLRNPHMLIQPYLRKEAVLSSKIEGTQSSLSELLLFEAGAQSSEDRQTDLREVANYVSALQLGIDRLPKLPISQRLIQDLHARLMKGVRGGDRTPGQFRTTQNWIGAPGTPIEAADFVPPPPGAALAEALDDWERFIHEEDALPPLVRCALMHYQFETIHPFSDGNGRIGRLLMPLFLLSQGHLSQPLLYLSAYFEAHRESYYDSLSEGRFTGNLIPWLTIFMQAVETQARDAATRADKLTSFEAEYRKRISKSRSSVIYPLLDQIMTSVYARTGDVARRHGVTYPTAQNAVAELVKVGVLEEVTGRSNYRIYAAAEILAVLEGSNARAARPRRTQ
jgi:cell filamentation protein, protein adenylyltransferase